MFVRYEKEKQNVPVKVWLPEDEIETDALEQGLNASRLPFVKGHDEFDPKILDSDNNTASFYK